MSLTEHFSALSRRLGLAPSALCLLVAGGCDNKDAKADEDGEAAAGAPVASTATGPSTLEMPLNSGSLPTDELDASALVTDPCTFANADEVAGYLAYLASKVEVERAEQRERGKCIYRAAKPETKLEIWFASEVRLRSSEKKITLAGLEDVNFRLLDESAEVTIPFPAAEDSGKPPASRLYVRIELYHSNAIPTWDAAYRAPDPAALDKAAKDIAENLITRLGLPK